MANICHLTAQAFEDGQRVASFLLNDPQSPEVVRIDVLEGKAPEYNPPHPVVCRWIQPYKARKAGESSERNLKLTTESLFLTLIDPATEPTEENARLLLFLALMLERKKILKPRGRTPDGRRNRYEHARSKQIFELPAEELTPDFFIQVQEQLSVLVGTPKKQQPSKPQQSGQSQAPAASLDKPA